jgi:hypothetical protein
MEYFVYYRMNTMVLTPGLASVEVSEILNAGMTNYAAPGLDGV